MHIVMVTLFPADPHHIKGGVAGVARYLVDELKKCPDVKLTVVVPKGNVGESVCEKWDNFEVCRAGISHIGAMLPGTIYDILIGRGKLNKVIRQLKPDLVHYQGFTFLASNCKFPHILTVHGIVEYDAMWERKGVVRWLRWLVLKLTEDYGRRRVPHIIMLSKYAEELLRDKINAQRNWLIENPIADSYFDVNWDYEAGRILFCGNLTRRKNPLGMVRAFALIADRFPNAQLRFAGNDRREPNYAGEYKRLVKSLNLQHRIYFLGNLSIDSVQEELSKANCLVLPSFQETAPLAIEEAMAVGVPVVASGICGMPYIVEDGKTGFLVDPYDTKSIYEAVYKILSDEALARAMGHRAREVAKKRFMASVICERTLQAYRAVLSEKI